jgi:NitT/TauT family transport system substrate-binding protein
MVRKNLSKKLVSGILAAAMVVLTACGNTNVVVSDNQNTTASTEAAQSSVADESTAAGTASAVEEKKDYGTLYVSFPTGNIRIAIDILALQLGYFDEEGVTVEPVNIGGTNALTAINDGSEQLDILTAGFVPDLQAIASGYDLTFIGGTAVEGGALIAKKGEASKYQDAGSIVNIEAIENAKLGLVRNEASWIVTRQYLLDNGVDEAEIAKIENEDSGNITYYSEPLETAQAVQKGEIEVGFLPMEYALLYADAYDLELITAAGDLQPDYVCCREVTSPAKVEEKKDAFVAYETARIKAYDYYRQGETDDAIKQNVIKIVADYSGKEADYVETYLYGGVTKFSVDPNANGIAKYVLAAYNSGALSSSDIDFGTYDISQNIDTSVYEQALKNVLAEDSGNAIYKELDTLYTKSN